MGHFRDVLASSWLSTRKWKQTQDKQKAPTTKYTTTQTELFFSRPGPQPEGWPHHGHTFSIYPYPLSFWLTLPRGVLSTYWCCPSRPCVVFLTCMHLALFLALSLSTGNSLVSSWCDHSMLASLLWQCLTVHSLLQLCWESTHLFYLLSTKPTAWLSVLAQRHQDVFLHSFRVSSFHSRTLLQTTLALSLVVSSLKSVCCIFSTFSAAISRLIAPCLTWYWIPSYPHHPLGTYSPAPVAHSEWVCGTLCRRSP